MSQSNKRRKPSNKDVTKKLQTELQALIAYGCYDSKNALNGGQSHRKDDLIKKINDLYMPKSGDDEHLSHVDMFLEGKGKYSYFFDTMNEGETIEERSTDPERVIPEVMHCIEGKTINVGVGCIDRSLLTRKNLTNYVDISANTLYRHAKDVEANCKKALALCTSKDSPYRNFKGTFPSGTNRNDYLIWLRESMNASVDSVDIDEDSDGNSKEDVDKSTKDDNDNAKSNEKSDSRNDKEKTMKDNYFKGYFAWMMGSENFR